jgi:uncharacterized membrane protein YeaQ/YmgE (transglycosylase-associated protein family)
MAAKTLLFTILLGGLLGIVGQGIRVIVGLKKLNDTADATNATLNSLFKLQQLIISLLIGFVAGVLATFSLNVSSMANIGNDIAMAIIGAGYAGTDFIEGFMRKANLSNQATLKPPSDKPAPPDADKKATN